MDIFQTNPEISRIFDLPRSHTAVAQWLFCILYILPLRKKRFSKPVSAVIAVLFFVPLYYLNTASDFKTGIEWFAYFFLCVAVMMAMMMTLGVLKPREMVYHWCQAFTAAEFAASAEWQINYYVLHAIQSDSKELVDVVSWSILVLTCMITAVVLYFSQNGKRAEHSHFHITRKDALTSGVIALAAFCIGNFPFAFRESSFTESLNLGVLWVRTLVDFGAIAMLTANENRRREINLTYELECTNRVMSSQYEQYRMFRANDESLHRVYHDLKNQIICLRQETDTQSRENSLKEMEDVIRRHEAATESKNSVLDTLLTSKNLTCIEKEITMVCFADAEKLAFMKAMDICSLFGNAIDNAIECEEKIEDKELRCIKVTVTPQGGMLLISVENYCEDAPEITDNTMQTTKADRSLHGYGLKSIKATVEKYDGYLNLNYEDHWFCLSALIPIEKA